jgi:hypothetical protein
MASCDLHWSLNQRDTLSQCVYALLHVARSAGLAAACTAIKSQQHGAVACEHMTNPSP